MESPARRARWTVLGATLLTLTLGSTAEADVIDFSVIDQTTPTGRIGRIGPATFSYDLYTHPDGFQWYNGDSAYNFYGENLEYIDFDQPVFLNSIDLAQFDPSGGLIVPTSVIFNLYDDQLGLIKSKEVFPTLILDTFVINTPGVSRIEFEFTGGGPFYGDGRDHAWYQIDNIVYDADPLTLDANPNVVVANDLLTFTTSEGQTGKLNLLVAVDVNGLTTFTKVDVGLFDAAGQHVFSATVPGGLTGLDVTFASIGFAQSGVLELSNLELVQFQ